MSGTGGQSAWPRDSHHAPRRVAVASRPPASRASMANAEPSRLLHSHWRKPRRLQGTAPPGLVGFMLPAGLENRNRFLLALMSFSSPGGGASGCSRADPVSRAKTCKCRIYGNLGGHIRPGSGEAEDQRLLPSSSSPPVVVEIPRIACPAMPRMLCRRAADLIVEDCPPWHATEGREGLQQGPEQRPGSLIRNGDYACPARALPTRRSDSLSGLAGLVDLLAAAVSVLAQGFDLVLPAQVPHPNVGPG